MEAEGEGDGLEEGFAGSRGAGLNEMGEDVVDVGAVYSVVNSGGLAIA